MDNIKLTKDGISVVIATSKDTENLTKNLTVITPPVATASQESDPTSENYGDYVSKILDILAKAERRISIDGFLNYGNMEVPLGTPETHTDSANKKIALREMFLSGGSINLTYEGDTITGNIDKLEIERLPIDGKTMADGEAEFLVKFTFICGESLTSGG